ncbi:hypothetical protein J5U18_08255 [Sphingobacteriaceae bacterium WQ 2009]|uniref:Uncharacterized protein n=1 Tax=Rhinopithecimicrobium faecis TaxID=2820698 RepID=A0A8T4HFV7_9SPHI|nr:hypothetical protein [Sphingobacteriaceae bacterium WQ 2009]
MIPFTQTSLDKLESLFKTLGFKVRYEKGSFRTGACMLENSKVIVVNKFSNLEVKIQSLVSILKEIDIEVDLLEEKQLQFYHIINPQ